MIIGDGDDKATTRIFLIHSVSASLTRGASQSDCPRFKGIDTEVGKRMESQNGH